MSSLSGAQSKRFWSRVIPEPNSGCWLWLGSTRGNGYGGGWANGKNYRAHRIAYEYCVGPIPTGLTIDHLCRNRVCVDPKHLEPVTAAENALRGYGWAGTNARKTVCLRGHEYTPNNTMWTRKGRRRCRSCHRLRLAAERRASRAGKEVVREPKRSASGHGAGDGPGALPQQEART